MFHKFDLSNVFSYRKILPGINPENDFRNFYNSSLLAGMFKKKRTNYFSCKTNTWQKADNYRININVCFASDTYKVSEPNGIIVMAQMYKFFSHFILQDADLTFFELAWKRFIPTIPIRMKGLDNDRNLFFIIAYRRNYALVGFIQHGVV